MITALLSWDVRSGILVVIGACTGLGGLPLLRGLGMDLWPWHSNM